MLPEEDREESEARTLGSLIVWARLAAGCERMPHGAGMALVRLADTIEGQFGSFISEHEGAV